MRFIGLFLLSCWCCVLQAQPQQQKIIDNGYNNAVTTSFVLRTADKGLLIGNSPYTGSQYVGAVCKLDSFGMVQWSRQYADTAALHQALLKSAVIDGPNYVLAGVTDSSAFTPAIHLLKCDGSGNIIWSQSWKMSGDPGIINLGVKSVPGGYVVGYSFSIAIGTPCTCLVWFDTAGNRLQTKYYTGMVGVFTALETDNNGNVYVAEYSGNDGYLSKVNAAGNAIWTKLFTGNTPVNMHIGPDNNLVLLLKHSNSTLAKIDTAGNIIWLSTIAVPIYVIAADFSISNDGEYYLAMNNIQSPSTDVQPHAKVAKFSGSGNPLWVMSVDHATADGFYLIVAITDRIAVFGRQTDSTNTRKIFMAVMDSAGNTNCTQQRDTFFIITPNVTVTPATIQPTSTTEIILPPVLQSSSLTIRQTNLCYTGMMEHASDNATAITIFPNPGDGNFTLSGELPNDARIEVYNTLGQMVYRKQLSPGSNQQAVQLGALAPGVYVWKIISYGREEKRDRLVIAR
jgi:hypothetical protein